MPEACCNTGKHVSSRHGLAPGNLNLPDSFSVCFTKQHVQHRSGAATWACSRCARPSTCARRGWPPSTTSTSRRCGRSHPAQKLVNINQTEGPRIRFCDESDKTSSFHSRRCFSVSCLFRAHVRFAMLIARRVTKQCGCVGHPGLSAQWRRKRFCAVHRAGACPSHTLTRPWTDVGVEL